MRSLDTNVVVRIILNDDPTQSLMARSVLAAKCLLTTTVVLESFWVLTSVAGLTALQAAAELSDLVDGPTVHAPDLTAINQALAKVAEGADFADMLHLALSGQADCFTTFDRKIARHADDSTIPVELLI